jgi:hypothetical protein
MYLRIKRNSDLLDSDGGENNTKDQEVIIYDCGNLKRRFKRLRISDDCDDHFFDNFVPSDTIYCPSQDLVGSLLIPQVGNNFKNKPNNQVQEEYLYYELEPSRETEKTGIEEDEPLVFQPLVIGSEKEESYFEEDDEDSNAEGYYTNDYPDGYYDTFDKTSSLYNNFDPDDYYEE